ncbi:aldehyde dehydrogenase [Nocardia sp. NPDC058499]|uniref:aldehyde dehydrogenase n=1 Tax=Nocardia sp. NPDC058499 TaxID=3346530 RepID=UPI003647F479
MTAPTTTFEHSRHSFYINGGWRRAANTQPHQLYEAATGEPLGDVPMGSEADIDAAIDAARRAFDDGAWSSSADIRVAALRRFADELQARRDTTAELVSRENGMPSMMSAMSNTDLPVMLLNQYAGLLEQRPREELRQSMLGATIVRQAPYGVVAAIVPWNFPQFMAMAKIAPALAAGNTVIVKPSPETSLDSYILAEAAEAAGIPPGVLNIVPAGREAGAYLVAHPEVDKVSFTGSTVAGRAIGEACGRLVRPVTLELGGKSAAIILDDADLDAYTANLVQTSFVNNGQTCVTHSRILAPVSRYREVLDAVVGAAESLKVGNPLDPTVMCGPMATSTHRDRVLGYIERGAADGAKIATGGGIPQDQPDGWFVAPTVFSDVDNASALAQEEVFGPVIAVIPFETEEDAIRMANESIYGLAGSVWTSDEARGIDIARRIRTGTIGVNYYQMDLNAPFGGFKASGIGREFGPEGLDAYTQYQAIYVSADQLSS